MEHQVLSHYSRYIDDIVMTWNKSEEELTELLKKANEWHPNIKLDYKIDRSLPFLDVRLTNDDGHLITSSYHKPAAEPYVVPFLSDHPRHIFANVIHTALSRAARYSSTFELFEHERRFIKLMLLYNGQVTSEFLADHHCEKHYLPFRYPWSFIDKEFQKFFLPYQSSSSSTGFSPFLPFIRNEEEFLHMNRILLGQPTLRQTQVTNSAAAADTSNHQQDLAPHQPIENQQHKRKPFENRLLFHYTHENRFQSFKRDMHQLYEHVFNDPSLPYVKMIVGSRNRRNTIKELIRKRPTKSVLRNTTIKSK